MEHVVFFSSAPGEPEFRRVGDLEEAVHLVERLRNERGISDVSLHSLTPVPVSFRTYYRVEIGGDAALVGAEPEAVGEPSITFEPLIEPLIDSEPSVAVEPSIAVEQRFLVEEPGPSFSLLRQPAGSDAVFDLGEPAEVEPFVDEVTALDDEVPSAGPVIEPALLADDPAALPEPLVPQGRAEPEVERSLGYFAS